MFFLFELFECAKTGTGHQETIKLLEVLYIAMVDELTFLFFKHCEQKQLIEPQKNYWNWNNSHVKNPIYMHCQNTTLTFLRSIMVFRVNCGGVIQISYQLDDKDVSFLLTPHTLPANIGGEFLQ